jgi:general secretion pathway protein K
MLDFARGAGVVPAAPTAGGAATGNEDEDNPGLRDDELAAARFALLLQTLDLPPALLPAVLDWLDADSEPRFPNGAEDDYYTRLEPAYRAANGRFADVSELRLVRGVSEEIYGRLAPYVTVLDSPTPINVNTAPPEILMSLGPGIDRSTAEMLIAAREVQPFQDLDALMRHPLLIGRAVVPGGIATGSRWFELESRVEHEELPHFRRSLLFRMEPARILTLRRAQRYTDG